MPPKGGKKNAQQPEMSEEELLKEFSKKGANKGSVDISKQAAKVMEQLGQEMQMQQRAQMMQQQQQIFQMQADEERVKALVRDANRTQNPGRLEELHEKYKQWHEVKPGSGKYVRYAQFQPDMMDAVMKMVDTYLPEPYTTPTYEYFIMGYPDLCILLYGAESKDGKKPEAGTKGDFIGCIVSSLKNKDPVQGPLRGYIAMLAVLPEWRGHRLGQELVKITIEIMRDKKAAEVCLETPTSNSRAVKLYTDVGFTKTKYLTRYYMDGSDAVRLMLWFEAPENLLEMQMRQQLGAAGGRMPGM